MAAATAPAPSPAVTRTAGAPLPPVEETAVPAEPAKVFAAECGACHMPYPAALLPARSWQAIMAGLAGPFRRERQSRSRYYHADRRLPPRQRCRCERPAVGRAPRPRRRRCAAPHHRHAVVEAPARRGLGRCIQASQREIGIELRRLSRRGCGPRRLRGRLIRVSGRLGSGSRGDNPSGCPRVSPLSRNLSPLTATLLHSPPSPLAEGRLPEAFVGRSGERRSGVRLASGRLKARNPPAGESRPPTPCARPRVRERTCPPTAFLLERGTGNEAGFRVLWPGTAAARRAARSRVRVWDGKAQNRRGGRFDERPYSDYPTGVHRAPATPRVSRGRE